MPPILLLLALGQVQVQVEVQVQDVQGVEPDRVSSISDIVRSGLEELGHSNCRVVLRIYAGAATGRVLADAFCDGKERHATADYPIFGEHWRDRIRRLVKDLARELPVVSAAPAPPLDLQIRPDPALEEEHRSASMLGPAALFLAGTSFLAAGIVFGVTSQSARTDLHDPTLASNQVQALAGRSSFHSQLSLVLLSAAVVCSSVGVTWWFVQSESE